MTDHGEMDPVRNAVRDYNEPPPTPREEIWAALAAARRPALPFSARRPVGPARWIGWGAALAASLVVGFGAGRATAPSGSGEQSHGEIVLFSGIGGDQPVAAARPRASGAAERGRVADSPEQVAKSEPRAAPARADAASEASAPSVEVSNRLAHAFDDVPDRQVRLRVLDLLAAQGDAEAATKLQQVAESEPDPELRQRARVHVARGLDHPAAEASRESMADRPR